MSSESPGRAVRQLATIAGATSFYLLGPTSDYGPRSAYRSPVVPAAGAFSIWGPIFLSNLPTLWLQTTSAGRRDVVLRRIALPLAVARGGAGLWSRAFGVGSVPLTLGTIGATWGAAALAYGRLRPAAQVAARDRWLVNAPVGLLFGWLTVAAVAAKSEALLGSADPMQAKSRSEPLVALTPEELAAVSIAGTGALAAAVTVGVDRSLAFPAAVAWGLAGIVVRQVDRRPAVAAGAAGALLGLGAAAVIALMRRRRSRRKVAHVHGRALGDGPAREYAGLREARRRVG